MDYFGETVGGKAHGWGLAEYKNGSWCLRCGESILLWMWVPQVFDGLVCCLVEPAYLLFSNIIVCSASV